MNVNQLVRQLIEEGGAIVSSNDCHEIEIADARACGRFAVDNNDMGFVRRTKKWLERIEKISVVMEELKSAAELAEKEGIYSEP